MIVSLVAGASVPVLVAFLARELMRPTDNRACSMRRALPGRRCHRVLPASCGSRAWWRCRTRPHSPRRPLGAWLIVVDIAAAAIAWALLLGAAAATFAVEIRLVYGFAALALFVVAAVALAHVYRRDRRRAAIHAFGASIVVLLVAAPTIAPVVMALAAGTDVPFLGQIGVHSWDPAMPSARPSRRPTAG